MWIFSYVFKHFDLLELPLVTRTLASQRRPPTDLVQAWAQMPSSPSLFAWDEVCHTKQPSQQSSWLAASSSL